MRWIEGCSGSVILLFMQAVQPIWWIIINSNIISVVNTKSLSDNIYQIINIK
jgi:hypothetical protein